RGGDVGEHGTEPLERRRVGGDAEPADAPADLDAGLGLALVDSRETGDGDLEASFRRRCGNGREVLRSGPGRAVDARAAGLLREGPGPDLLGYVGENGGEEPEQDVEAEPESTHRRAPRGGSAVARADLHQLEEGVGEVMPEERLRLHEGAGEVELLVRGSH